MCDVPAGLFVGFCPLFCGCSVNLSSGEQEEVFLYGEEISVDATEKEEEVSRHCLFTPWLSCLPVLQAPWDRGVTTKLAPRWDVSRRVASNNLVI